MLKISFGNISLSFSKLVTLKSFAVLKWLKCKILNRVLKYIADFKGSKPVINFYYHTGYTVKAYLCLKFLHSQQDPHKFCGHWTHQLQMLYKAFTLYQI